MGKTGVYINRHFTKGTIDPMLYGSFVEHMGRVVYSGIYEPQHPTANEDGFREDVLKLTRDMGVKAVRYPGGNFVSSYNWLDGVGPKELRPRKRELAWRSIETNEVGTDEYMKWAAAADVETIMAVNLGTRGIENAVGLLEYCNMETGTYYSDMRAENGHPEPYGIKYWCLGNEMDGEWQIGHKTAEEYGRLAAETGKAMRVLDPSIKLIACGSSLSSNSTYPEWEETVLSHTYDYIDYLALHQYYGHQEWGTAEFLAQTVDLSDYIHTVISACDVAKTKHRSGKKLYLSIDEWGVWQEPDEGVDDLRAGTWPIAGSFSEQIYTLEDALLFASMMMTFLKFSERVRITCQSLLTNISACIMTERGGESWKQTIYYPYQMIARFGKGTVLDGRFCDEPCGYLSERYGKIPFIDHVEVWNEADNELVFFALNRSDTKNDVEWTVSGFDGLSLKEHTVLTGDDIKATNKENHDRIIPKEGEKPLIKDGQISVALPPYSFSMLRLSVNR